MSFDLPATPTRTTFLFTLGNHSAKSIKRLFSPVNSPSTVGTCSCSSLRSSSFLATLRSSRGHASSSDVVFNITNPSGARAGDWINCSSQQNSFLNKNTGYWILPTTCRSFKTVSRLFHARKLLIETFRVRQQFRFLCFMAEVGHLVENIDHLCYHLT